MLHHASRQLCPVLVMNLFGGIHFPVGLGQKVFRVRAILRVKHRPQARSQHIRAAHLAAGLLCHGAQQPGSFADRTRCQTDSLSPKSSPKSVKGTWAALVETMPSAKR